MYSAGISTDTLQADVQQTQENLVDTETDVTPQEDDVETGSDQPTSDDNTNSATDSVTEVSTTTQPSFGASDSTPDLIEQVGEPSNALVDTV